jgi:branched-chain amino acid transport system permease protein
MIDAISLGSLYALAAIGIGLVFGVMRLLNLAHGELIMVGGYSLYMTSRFPLVIGLLLTAAVVMVSALLMERLAFRPLRGSSPATLLIASFALSFGLENLARMTFGPLPKMFVVSPRLTGTVRIGDMRITVVSIVTIVTSLVLLGLLTLLLKKSSLGIQVRAASDDFLMARMLGVSANRTIALAFAIGGLLAAAVSVMAVAQTGGVNPRLGREIVLLALLGTVIGGMDRLQAAAYGGFILGFAMSLAQSYLPLQMRPFQSAIVVAVVVLVLLLRPQGLWPGGTISERVA